MAGEGPTITVHCGPNLVFSCTKQLTDVESGGKTAALASSLREAQVRVNQFLTQLVEKGGSSDQHEGGDEEASDEEDEEADGEYPSPKKPETVKRKLEGNGVTEGKRTKSHT